ncbi:Uncharacterised protein [Delftia tsuruhatensis]|nr:Uncharacterised protein [Delftia tsuruhatensis]
MQLGEAYLTGTAGIPRNVPTGVGYLKAAMSQARRQASVCIAMHLSLPELLEHGLLEPLEIAAQHEDAGRLKLAALQLARGDLRQGREWLGRCSSPLARELACGCDGEAPSSLLQALLALRVVMPADICGVVAHEARAAMEAGQSLKAVLMLETLADLQHTVPGMALHQLIVDVVREAESHGHGLGRLQVGRIEAALEHCAGGGDLHACHVLGRALAGLPCAHLAPERLVGSQNLRKAAALLLRAADGGIAIAWLHLFRICSDYRSSVANPTLARFCLEKAARYGLAEAERRLGALVLRDATQIEAMEQGVGLLHAAAGKGDTLANLLLGSLILPVAGSDEEAWAAIDEVQHAAPLLAMRLRLARAFGLTKLEALSVNPSAAMRPWGMVVGRNPFVAKARLCEPRAVPAVSEHARECLEMAASMFSVERQESVVLEGSLRVRALQMRRLFQRLQLQEGVFFASASSHEREAMRVGTKWAKRQRSILQQVLG